MTLCYLAGMRQRFRLWLNGFARDSGERLCSEEWCAVRIHESHAIRPCCKWVLGRVVNQANDGDGQVEGTEEVAGGLVVTGGDGPVLLD